MRSAGAIVVALLAVVVPCAPGGASTADVVPLRGDRLRLVRAAKASRLMLRTRDAAIDLGDGPGSEDDPTLHGATVRLLSFHAPFESRYVLPADGWRASRKHGVVVGYRYRGSGTIRRVRVRGGRLLEMAGVEREAPWPLANLPVPVHVVLTLGIRPYCLTFGGDVRYRRGKRLRARRAPAPEGCPVATGSTTISGRVLAAVGDRTIIIPGAHVALLDERPGAIPTETDARGHFAIALTVPEPHDVAVCAARDGFADACATVPVQAGESAVANVTLHPLGGALLGTALDLDGRPCRRAVDALGAGVRTEVDVDDGAGTAQAGVDGVFVLPGITPGQHVLRARCAGAEAAQEESIAAGDLDGGRSIALVLPNHAPHIAQVVARDSGGQVLRRADPGATVEVALDASDPDGDPLEVRWLDGRTGPLAGDGAVTSWTLMDTPARNTLYVEVSDGRGGFDRDVLEIGTGVSGVRFGGVVADAEGMPLAGAMVDVGGAVTTTDAAGRFRVVAVDADRYALTVAEPDHVPVSRVLDSSAVDLELRMQPAAAYEIDPTVDQQIDDPDTGLGLFVPAYSLVDADGNVAASPLRLRMHRRTLDEEDAAPGDGLLADPDGAPSGARVVSGAFLQVTDGEGRPYQPAPDRAAVVTLPPPVASDCNAPQTPIASLYDPPAGGWTAIAQPLLPGVGGSWSVETTALGDLAVVLPFERTCIRFRADRPSIVVPLELRLAKHHGCFDDQGLPIYDFERQVWVPDYDWHEIGNLEVGAYYRLTALPQGTTGAAANGPGIVQYFRAAAGPATDTYPFHDCTELPTLLERFAVNGGDFGSYSTSEGEAGALSYYQSIGALPALDTFAKWKTAFGFDDGAAATARFYNAAELGIGRDVACRGVGKGLACYIVKYGAPGGPVAETLDDLLHGTNPGDTVAMETKGGADDVRFYAYAASGEIKLATAFTPYGPDYMPGACWPCHAVTTNGYHYYGGQFLPMDPNTHVYPPGLPRSVQAPALRALNALVAGLPTVQANVQIETHIARLYPGGVDTPGSAAIDLVPPTWAAAGTGGEKTYRLALRPNCQLCHLARLGLDWTDLDNFAFSKASDYVCNPDWEDRVKVFPLMPRAFVPARNLLQDATLLALLQARAKHGFCSPPLPPPRFDEQPSPPGP